MSNELESDEISPAVRARLQECYEYGNRKMTQGDFDYATEMFSQCVTADPGNIMYLQAFILNLHRKYNDNKKGSSMMFIKGAGIKRAVNSALGKGKWTDVIKNGVEMLKLNPWDTATLMAMGKACLELGHNIVGLAYYKHAVEANPNDVETNRTSAKALAEIDEFDHAISCWNRVLKVKPNDEEARKTIGDLMVEKTIRKGKYDSSLEDKSVKGRTEKLESKIQYEEQVKLSPEEEFEKKLRKEPENEEIYLDYYDYYFQANQIKKAEDVLIRLLKVVDTPRNQMKLLECQRHRLLDDVTKIKNDYEATDKPEIKEKLKPLFFKRKEELEKKTEELYHKRVAETPGNAGYRYDLGQMYLQQKKFKEAITQFQAAKSDISLLGDCLLALGQCFQQIKQYKLAMTHYAQAAETIQDDGETKKKTLLLAAKLAFGLKDYEQADFYASKLAGIDFSYKDVGELLDKIANVRQN
ncbi:MAG: tetratricopeptide repeat protein [Planctomycetaceae bacterium]|jgi:tetratricopeptide (TPR) repeat protein|nr:tetratricopeptide repeat protein [Planctomycetaceae bacterium]